MMKYAFIFARGGSKELKNKNLKFFLKKPLVKHSIHFAKKTKIFDKIILSSDSNKILNIGKKEKIFTIKRPKKMSKSNSPEIDAWIHAINFLKNKNYIFDIMVVLPCTSPLRNKKDVVNCINLMDKKTHIVTTISKTKLNPGFNMFKKNKNNFIESFTKTDNKYYRRQDLPKIFTLTNSVYVTYPKNILSKKVIFNKNIKGLEIPKERSIDIDDKVDFSIAEFLAKKNKI